MTMQREIGTKTLTRDEYDALVDKVIARLDAELTGMGKTANLFSFVLMPYTTAIGAAFDYNRDMLLDHYRQCLRVWHDNPNVAYDLDKVCQWIDRGEI